MVRSLTDPAFTLNRRRFLASAVAAAVAASVSAAEKRRPRILLRNAWQSQNIGDIAHYLGFLELMETHGLDAEVRLWPGNLDNGADALLARRFPDVRVLQSPEAVAAAFRECDFFLHGSGSGFGAWKHAARWSAETGKPFGVFGISLTETNPELLATLSRASFAYFRDSTSLRRARELGCTCPVLEFGPDTAFGAVRLRNDDAAVRFLATNRLEEGKFLCCIPRYRWTPFWTIHSDRPVDSVKLARNHERKEPDHAPLRAAIVAVTRETDQKVLICCEDQTQIALGKEMLFDPLPDDVKAKVVWRPDYWLTDEALSVYARSAGLFGNEMHSPILCVANGVPAVVCRFDEQTCKGFMWRDIGLGEWLFDLDDPGDVARIAPAVLAIAKDPAAAKAKTVPARKIVQERQAAMFAALRKALNL